MEISKDPNSFNEELNQDPNKGTAPELNEDGTPKVPPIDYEKKFSESSKEAQRLFRENQEKDRLIAELQAKKDPLLDSKTDLDDAEILYPGFEELDEDAQRNLLAYTETVTKRAREQILQDPAISFARLAYNEKKFNDAFDAVSSMPEYSALKDSKEDFKSKYFNPNNVPENIETILTDVAKIYLFDRAKEIGAEQERIKAERIDLERGTGGDKEPPQSRTLEEWNRMAQENPAKFAKLSKEFNADMEAGKLKE